VYFVTIYTYSCSIVALLLVKVAGRQAIACQTRTLDTWIASIPTATKYRSEISGCLVNFLTHILKDCTICCVFYLARLYPYYVRATVWGLYICTFALDSSGGWLCIRYPLISADQIIGWSRRGQRQALSRVRIRRYCNTPDWGFAHRLLGTLHHEILIAHKKDRWMWRYLSLGRGWCAIERGLCIGVDLLSVQWPVSTRGYSWRGHSY